MDAAGTGDRIEWDRRAVRPPRLVRGGAERNDAGESRTVLGGFEAAGGAGGEYGGARRADAWDDCGGRVLLPGEQRMESVRRKGSAKGRSRGGERGAEDTAEVSREIPCTRNGGGASWLH